MKSKKFASDAFLPVPAGTRIKYQHYYIRKVKSPVWMGKRIHEDDLDTDILFNPPVLVGTGAWLVHADTGNDIPNTFVKSRVHPNDTAVKKLGRLKAHNRCIKAYLKHT
jgi:hypothetical protein